MSPACDLAPPAVGDSCPLSGEFDWGGGTLLVSPPSSCRLAAEGRGFFGFPRCTRSPPSPSSKACIDLSTIVSERMRSSPAGGGRSDDLPRRAAHAFVTTRCSGRRRGCVSTTNLASNWTAAQLHHGLSPLRSCEASSLFFLLKFYLRTTDVRDQSFALE